MRSDLTYWIERLTSDPRVRDRMLSTLDALGQKPSPGTSGRKPDVVIDRPGPVAKLGTLRAPRAVLPAPGRG